MKRRIVSLLLAIAVCVAALPSIVLADTAEAIVTPAEGVAEAQEATPAEGVAEPQEATPAEGVAEPQEPAPAEGVPEPQEPAPVEGVPEPQKPAPVEGVPEPQGDPSEAAYVYEPTEEVVDAEAALVAPTIKTVTYGNFEGQNPMVHVSCADPDGHKVLEVYTLKEGYNEGDGMGKVVSEDGTKVYTIVGIQTLERNMENVWEDDDGNLHMKTELYSGDNGEYRPNPGDPVTITISGEVLDENGYREEIAKGVDITVPPVGEIVDVEVKPACTHSNTHYEFNDSVHWIVCNDCGNRVTDDSLHLKVTTYSEDRKKTWNECICGWKSAEACTHLTTHVIYDDAQHYTICDDCGTELSRANHAPEDKTSEDGTRTWKECACGWRSAEACTHLNTQVIYDDARHYTVCDSCGVELSRADHAPEDKVSEDGATTWKECVCGWKSNPVPRETSEPTTEPSAAPTEAPTTEPSAAPTEAPTTEPSAAPSDAPTTEPSAAPTSHNVVVTTPEPTPDNGQVVPSPSPTKKAREKADPKKCKHKKYRWKYTVVDGEVHDCTCRHCGKYLGQEKHTFKTVQTADGDTVEKCSKCNYMKCDHRGTAVWNWNKNEHWVWCDRCLTVVGQGAHAFTPTALMIGDVTYTNAKFCRCGFATVEIDGKVMIADDYAGELVPLDRFGDDDFLDKLSKDDLHLSDEELAELMGQVAAPETAVVEECKHEHLVYTAEAIKHPNVHWQECADCGKLFGPVPHQYNQLTVKTPATCTANAVLERKCVCGHVDTENTSPQKGDPAEYFAHHVYDGYKSNYRGHYQKCTRCGKETPEEAHTVTNVKVLREPTCLMIGQVSFDCGVCGYHEEAEATDSTVERYPALSAYQALGHDFSGPPKKVSGPLTCTEESQGEHAATCTRCGSIDYDHPTAHAWRKQTVSNGTCEDETDSVVIEGTCECGAKLKLTYTRHHKPVLDTSKDVEPTCTEPGKINGHRCLYCGIFYDYEFAEALGHEWFEDPDSRVEPTCETTGSYKRWCERCGVEETVTIPTISESGHHEFVRANLDSEPVTCGGSYRYIMKCKYCDADDGNGIYVEEVAGHDVQTETKTGPVTTHNDPDGEIMEVKSIEITLICKRCGKTLGHEWRTLVTTPKGNVYKLLIGKNTVPVSLHGGERVTGQMGKDGGVYYRNEVNKAVDAEIKRLAKEYEEVK